MYVAVAVIVFITCCMCAENLEKILVQLRLNNMGGVLTTQYIQRFIADLGLLLTKDVIPILKTLTLAEGCIVSAMVLPAAAGAVLLAMSAYQRNEFLAKLGVECVYVANGAALGTSVCPGFGTAIGAVIGGLSGYLLVESTTNHAIAHKED